MAKVVKPEDRTLTLTAIAAAAGRSKDWVADLAKAKLIERTARGEYRIASVIGGIVAHYEAIIDRGAKSKSASRATDARTREIEQRIAIKDRTLIPIEDAEQAIQMLVGVVTEELSGLASRCTRDVPLRKKIEDEVHGSKGRIAAALAKMSEAARTGRGLDDPGADSDA